MRHKTNDFNRMSVLETQASNNAQKTGGFKMESILDSVIENFEKLSLEDKEFTFDLIRKQLIEAEREAIFFRAQEAIDNFKKGNVRKGTVEDLYKDIEDD